MMDENMTPEIDTEEESPERGAFDTFVYHQRRALEETGKALESLLPEGFKVHSAEARKEFTKGFKALVDAALSELDKVSRRGQAETDEDEDDRPSTTGKTKVKVQVD